MRLYHRQSGNYTPQGLKAHRFCRLFGTTEEAAEIPRRTSESPERRPSVAKAHVDFTATYGTTKVVPLQNSASTFVFPQPLKSCPITRPAAWASIVTGANNAKSGQRSSAARQDDSATGSSKCASHMQLGTKPPDGYFSDIFTRSRALVPGQFSRRPARRREMPVHRPRPVPHQNPFRSRTAPQRTHPPAPAPRPRCAGGRWRRAAWPRPELRA